MASFAEREPKAEAAGGASARKDGKAALGVPSLMSIVYVVGCAACFSPWALTANSLAAVGTTAPSVGVAAGLALLAGIGPVALAYLLPHGAGGTPASKHAGYVTRI